MPMTPYLADRLLNHAFRGGVSGTTYDRPSAVYVALHNGNPGTNGNLNEIPSTRRLVTFAASSDGEVKNSNIVTWVMGTTTVTHFSIWDAASGGNCLQYGEVSTNSFLDGDEYSLPPGALLVSRKIS